MFNPNNGFFTLPNLLALARAAVPVCDTTLDRAPDTAHELGPNWEVTSLLSYESGVKPQACLFQDDSDNAVVVVGGLGSLADWRLASEGSLNLATFSKLAGRFNAYCVQWATAAEAWWTGIFRRSFRSVVVVGHSMGGTVAPCLGHLMDSAFPNQRVGIFTCGAPRFTDRVGARSLSRLPIYRLMNYADPTPAVPPRPVDAPLIYPLLSPRQIEAWLQLVHTSGGARVNAAGALEQADTPTGYLTPLQFDVRTAWTLYQNEALPAHAMMQYAQRLEALVPRYPELRLHNARPEPTPEEPVKASEVAEVQAQAREYIAMQTAQQTRVPSSTTRSLIRIKKRDRRWFVEINGKPFYTATSKRDAIGVARASRDFARQYLQNPTLFSDPDALISELDAS